MKINKNTTIILLMYISYIVFPYLAGMATKNQNVVDMTTLISLWVLATIPLYKKLSIGRFFAFVPIIAISGAASVWLAFISYQSLTYSAPGAVGVLSLVALAIPYMWFMVYMDKNSCNDNK